MKNNSGCDHVRSGGGWRVGVIAMMMAALSLPLQGQYTWTNLAGRGSGAGYEDGIGVEARMESPTGIVMAAPGNAYFTDTENHVVRMITPDGVVSTFAGSPGVFGSANGSRLDAKFRAPSGLAVDGEGNLYVADTNNHTVRKVSPAGVVTTLAGSTGLTGWVDGIGGAARFTYPKALAFANDGKLHVLDSGFAVRTINLADRSVTTLAGTPGTRGYLDAVGTKARFSTMSGVVALADGSLRVTDTGNHCLRAIAPDGGVSTLAGLAASRGSTDGLGAAARFNQPGGLAMDPSGNLYVGDLGGKTIRRVDAGGLVTTISGLVGVAGDRNGGPSAGTYRSPQGIARAADGSLWIADTANSQIRRLAADGEVTTLAGCTSIGSDDGQGESAGFNAPDGMALDADGFVYVSDRNNNTVRKISPDGTVTTLAGLAGQTGYVDATGSAARFNYPRGLCVDPQGNVIVSERFGGHLRKITPAGVVSTFATLANAVDVVRNTDGNFFAVAMDSYLYRFSAGGSMTTAAGTGGGVIAESVPLAQNLQTPIAAAVNGSGKVFFIGYNSSSLKVLNPGVSVRTLSGGSSGYADGWGVGLFYWPVGVAADADGNCFVADSANNCIRKVTRAGLVSTIGGTVGMTGNGVGVGNNAKFYYPASVVMAADGTLYVANNKGNNILKGVLTGPEIEVRQASSTVPTATVESHEHRRFGVLGVGRTEAMRFSIKNRGAADLAGIAVSLDGADAGEFTVISQPSDRLAAGAETSFVVRFSPTTAGSKAAALHITSTDLDEGVFDITLFGTAVTDPAAGLVWKNWAGVPSTAGSLCENADESKFQQPRQLAVGRNGDLFVPDAANYTILKISPNGQVSLVAGFAGAGGSANGRREDATFKSPYAVACDGNDVLYVVEKGGNRIRRIDTDGTTTTLATGLSAPSGVAWDPITAGLVVANTSSHSIVRVTSAGVITTLAGTGSSGSSDGTGTAAKFSYPEAVTVDPAGTVFVADTGNHTIRRIGADGAVTTMAGNAGVSGSADGQGAAAMFHSPAAIALDGAGGLLVADTGNSLIRRIDAAGNVTTLGGTGGATGDGTGQGVGARFNSPAGIAMGRNGHIYVANRDTYNIVESAALGGDLAVDQVGGGTLVAGAGVPMATQPDTSVFQQFRIRNLGTGALAAISAALTGADAGEFAIFQQPAATLAPGAETILTVGFDPVAVGSRSAGLEIASDDPDQNPFVIHLLGTASVPFPAPVLVTQAATDPTETSASLHGTINPQDQTAAVSFDYGLTTDYGKSVLATPSPVSGSATTAVGATLGGLSAGTTYHFRIAASHPSGVTHGEDLTFTTNAPPVFAGFALVTSYQTPATAAIVDLLEKATDPDGDAISITAAGPASANGGSAVLQTAAIRYTPPDGFSGSDSFPFVVTDARGASAIGIVTVTVGPPPDIVGETIDATFNSASSVPVTAAGYTAIGNQVTLALGFAPPVGTNLTLVNNTALDFIHGRFSNLAQGQMVTLTYGGATYRFVANYYGGSGNDLVLVWAGSQAFAWGSNASGQLGTRNLINTSVPAEVFAQGTLAGKTIISLAVGGSHSLALCADGTAMAWGNNYPGQLGNNTTTDSSVPVEVLRTGVLLGKAVVAVAAGGSHSLALCSDGSVAAWGNNDSGQLGNNSSTNSSVPVLVSPTGALAGKVVVAITAGGSHSLALCSDGTVAAWGAGAAGQLGDDSTDNSLVPVPVNRTGALAGKTVVALTAGLNHSLALCADGTIAAWGANDAGQLGNNSISYAFVPTAVVTSGVLAGKPVVAIAAGDKHSLALAADGTLAAWGANESGQLGDNTTTNSSVPVAVTRSSTLAGKTVVAIAGGASQSSALCADGTLAAWGLNSSGQLGDNSTTNSKVPVAVLNTQPGVGARFTTIGTGPSHNHNVALAAAPFNNTRLATLVLDYGGQLTTIPTAGASYAACVAHSAAAVTVIPTAEDIDARITVNGVAVPSGTGSGPLPLTFGTTAIVIGVTAPDGTVTNRTLTVLRPDDLTAAFASAGTIPVSFPAYDATGLSITLTLGFTPPTGTNLTVIQNTGLAKITGAFTNLAHRQVVALSYNNATYRFIANYHGGSGNDLVLQWANQKPYAWGGNGSGQLGNGSTTNAKLPAAVRDTGILKDKLIVALAAGATHSLALCADNTVAAWGANAAGQLGNNTTTSSSEPVAVTGTGVLAGKIVMAVAAGGTHSLALCSDGTVAAWGYNSDGQLGNNSRVNSSVPVAVDTTGVLAGRSVVAIAAGDAHSLALCADGDMVAWGSRNSGVLGDGIQGYNTSTSSSVPVAVIRSNPLLGRTVTAVAAGTEHNLALCADGTVVGWGSNRLGQLGNGGLSVATTPDVVSTTGGLLGKTVAAIAAGGGHCLALCSDGTLAAWGSNSSGQIGNNSTTTARTPVAVMKTGILAGKSVVGIVAGGSHSQAWCADGTLAAWGSNSSGQLGNNTTTNSLVPVAVQTSALGGGAKLTTMQPGFSSNHVLALAAVPFTNARVAGLVMHEAPLLPLFASGTTGYSACVSNATTEVTITPTAEDPDASVKVNGVPVPSGTASGPIPIAPGTSSIIIAVTSPDGTTTANTTLTVLRPSAVSATFTAASTVPVMFPGYDATGLTVDLALGFVPPVGTNLTVVKNTGSAFITGSFSNLAQGQTITLTYNNASYRFVANYYGGSGNDLVLQWAQNRIFAWGNNTWGQLGNNRTTSSSVPVATVNSGILAGKTIVALAGVIDHSLALCADGTLAEWGSGVGFRGTTKAPVQVQATGALLGKTVVSIAAAGGTDFALCSDGTLAKWNRDATTPLAIANVGALTGRTVTAIAAGYDHILALCSDGTLAAWGWNSYGQLGNNRATESLGVPVAVDASGVLAGKIVVGIAAGSGTNLVLCADGTLAAWGNGDYGQLGNGSTTTSSVPVAVTRTGVLAGKTVTAIASGTSHSLALCSDGTLAAWGYNYYGQLGNNNTSNSSVPVAVTRTGALSGKTVTAIAAGNYFNLAICSDGVATAWGNNASGQLGNNSTTKSTVPVTVSATQFASGEKPTGLAALSPADHSLALVTAPFNNSQLVGLAFGDSGPIPTFAPGITACPASVPAATTAVTVIPTVADPDALVRVNDTLITSGTASASIPIALGTNDIAVQVTSPDLTSVTTYTLTVVRVAAAVTASFNSATDIPVSLPAFDATGLTVDLALGFAPAIGTNLTVMRNTGPGVIAGRFSNLAQGQEITLNYQNSNYRFVANYYGGTGNDLVLQWSTTKAYAWGYNNYGELGNGSIANSNVPLAVDASGVLAGKTLIALSAGGRHCLALCADGTVAAWGSNVSGQLGDGTTNDSLIPVEITNSGVLAGRTVVAVSAGSSHSLALCSDGTMAAWGGNDWCQLANGRWTISSIPLAVPTPGDLAGRKMVAIFAANTHNLALCENGTLVGWGDNGSSQLGSYGDSIFPVPMPLAFSAEGALRDRAITALVAGQAHSLALCADGAVVAWGDNSGGQLGNNSNAYGEVPVEVLRTGALAGKTVVAVAAGSYHSLALCADGTVAAWGSNYSGQLGDSTTTASRVPVTVPTGGALAGKTPVTLAAGYQYSLVACADGGMAAWGNNGFGQLGNSGTTNSSVPVMVNTSGVPTNHRFVATAAKMDHCLALAASAPIPTLATLPATNLAATTATLHGAINPQDLETTVAFEYGLTTSYGSMIGATPSPVSGSVTTDVGAALGGLAAGTTYHYRLAATGPYGTTHGEHRAFTTNSPPTFAGYAIATPYQTPAAVTLGKLLEKAADADGDSLSVTACGPGSSNGGTAVLQPAAILYTPPAEFSGTDTFAVTISDAGGASVIATVTVTVGPAPGAGGLGVNPPVLTALPDGRMEIVFQGIPGRSYTVQRSVSGLDHWTTLATIAADAAGRLSFIDDSPPPGSAFYRLGIPQQAPAFPSPAPPPP